MDYELSFLWFFPFLLAVILLLVLCHWCGERFDTRLMLVWPNAASRGLYRLNDRVLVSRLAVQAAAKLWGYKQIVSFSTIAALPKSILILGEVSTESVPSSFLGGREYMSVRAFCQELDRTNHGATINVCGHVLLDGARFVETAWIWDHHQDHFQAWTTDLHHICSERSVPVSGALACHDYDPSLHGASLHGRGRVEAEL